MFGDLLVDHNGKKQPKKDFPLPNGIFLTSKKSPIIRFDIVWSLKMGQNSSKSSYSWKNKTFRSEIQTQRNGKNASGSSPRYSKLVEGARGHLRCLENACHHGWKSWGPRNGGMPPWNKWKKNWLNRSSQVVLLRILRDLGLGTEFLLCFWGFLPWKKLHLSFSVAKRSCEMSSRCQKFSTSVTVYPYIRMFPTEKRLCSTTSSVPIPCHY